ncbi:MAG: glutamate-1-semialdehyde 2,1-aminomutase [Chloroflexi bacterium]|jgi:glutamate-1-semialdehyde 2,1-aminomutase|nr:MAG: glutamate-1-semialdehyde 2,1-aminomutase [Chloroflexota bacterium]
MASVETIADRYLRLHPKSAELASEARDLFPDGVTHDARRMQPFPIFITHALGAQKWDVDGNEYVDYRTGHGALLLGHSHPDIVKAVQEQMGKGTHYGFSHELEVRWAQWVKHLMPSVEKVRFHNSGTEATMMAMRLARAYTGKPKILKFEEHFHGWHDYAAVGSGRGTGGIPEGTRSTMMVIPHNDAPLLERTLAENDDVAAVIIEPTGAHMGMYPTHPEFLGDLREITRRYGVLLIIDEVVTGFRTSPGGAHVRYDVQPDLTTMAKILGGGLPGGAVGGRADIMDMIQTKGDPAWDNENRVSHPGTFNGNPLSAAAGCKALELVATTPVNDTADLMAQRLRDGINELFQQMEIPGCAHGVASLVHYQVGVACDCDRVICNRSMDETRQGNRPQIIEPIRRALINAGVDTMSTNLILSAAHTEKNIDDTLAGLEEALAACRREQVL